MKKSLILFLICFSLNSICLHAANKLYEKIDLFGEVLEKLKKNMLMK